MIRKIDDEVAISAELAAVALLRAQRKMLPANDIRHFFNGLFGVHPVILIYEPPVRILIS